MSENELIARQRETSEAGELLEKSGNPPLVSLSGIRECIQTAAKEAVYLVHSLKIWKKPLAAIDKSSTGGILFIEPGSAGKY